MISKKKKKKGLHRNSKVFSGRNQKFKGFFRPNAGDLQTKKSLPPNSNCFSGRNQKFKGFFRPNAGDLQQKKKVFTEIERVFLAEIRNSKVFPGRNQLISKKKKKEGLHLLWVSSRTKKLHYSGPNNGKFFTTSAPKFLWRRGLFSFLEQKSASKALKTCYFAHFSGQWGASSPPATPGYATGRLSTTVIY